MRDGFRFGFRFGMGFTFGQAAAQVILAAAQVILAVLLILFLASLKELNRIACPEQPPEPTREELDRQFHEDVRRQLREQDRAHDR